MMRGLLHLLLVASMLCNFLGSVTGIKAQTMACGEDCNKRQVSRHDKLFRDVAEEPQSPVCANLYSSPFSHRVMSSRPARTLPSYGGKPNNHNTWRASVHSSILSKTLTLYLCQGQVGLCTGFSSPRFYYVIALRRILC